DEQPDRRHAGLVVACVDVARERRREVGVHDGGRRTGRCRLGNDPEAKSHVVSVRSPAVDLRIMTEPQSGASYDDILAMAQAAESHGFDAFFRSDHYMVFDDSPGLPGSTDAWITLAGIARETSTIRLGTLVTPIMFRRPGPLAISVAQVDVMSGGRVELGLGAGWFDREHTAY